MHQEVSSCPNIIIFHISLPSNKLTTSFLHFLSFFEKSYFSENFHLFLQSPNLNFSSIDSLKIFPFW